MKTQFSTINTELNALPIWKDKVCKNCGRKYPETVINIEEIIHHNHGKGPRCIDTDNCNSFRYKTGTK